MAEIRNKPEIRNPKSWRRDGFRFGFLSDF